jgi:hypothetical protein
VLGNIVDGLTGGCHPNFTYRNQFVVATPWVNVHSAATSMSSVSQS